MAKFRIVCLCGREGIITTDEHGLLKERDDRFEINLNVETVKLEIECKKCGRKFEGGD